MPIIVETVHTRYKVSIKSVVSDTLVDTGFVPLDIRVASNNFRQTIYEIINRFEILALYFF